MSSTTVGDLCDKTIEKFFKDKKYLSIGMLVGNNCSNGSNDAGYFGSWTHTRTSSWTSSKHHDGGALWSRQGPNQLKDTVGQKSRKQERKPYLRF